MSDNLLGTFTERSPNELDPQRYQPGQYADIRFILQYVRFHLLFHVDLSINQQPDRH